MARTSMFPIVAVHGPAIGRGENNTGAHHCTIEVLKASSGALVGPLRGPAKQVEGVGKEVAVLCPSA